MSIGLILVIFLLGGFRVAGYGGIGVIGAILIILLVLLFTGGLRSDRGVLQ